jgi:two-component system chemotaxis response regulator CheB
MSHSGQSAIVQEAATAPAEQSPVERPIRVMIVDDSAVVRGLVARWIDEVPGLDVVARHANGKYAVDDVTHSAPDVILLDIEMPVMDGLEALPLLLRARPEARVLMVSTLTKRNAEISFRALALGALDYVPKPDSNRDITLLPDFRDEVIRKIKALAGVNRFGIAGRTLNRAEPPFEQRAFSLVPPRVIAVGSSTGGTEALTRLFQVLSPSLDRVSVLIAQHMPPMFTTILAERLAKATGRKTKEGVDDEPVLPGTIYVAPGDHHMMVRDARMPFLRISHGAPVNFCRPAVDPLFASVADTFGPAVLGIVLTGMGQDGAAGARAIAAAGGSVIAQDEASSVVWGMPGAAAATGACAAFLPPREIANTAAKLIRGQRP